MASTSTRWPSSWPSSRCGSSPWPRAGRSASSTTTFGRGDSLLGITSFDQLENFHLDPVRGKSLHHTLFDPRHEIRGAVTKALELRQRLRAIRILDIEDVRAMARMDDEAKAVLRRPELAADLLVGAAIATTGTRGGALDGKLVELADDLKRAIVGGTDATRLEKEARELLDSDCPERLRPRRPFHWAIEFPEAFVRKRPGFDAIVGNPPFLGGSRITGVLGTHYRAWLVEVIAQGRRGTADLVAYFFLRATTLLRENGTFGLLAVNTIAEGDTRQVGLEPMLQLGAEIYAAYPNEPWPGSAAVLTSRVHICKGGWSGKRSLSNREVTHISPLLTERGGWTPRRLKASSKIAYEGAKVTGMGFLLSEHEAREMLASDPRNAEVIFPYLNGDDLNTEPQQRPSRWAICFWDWPEERARSHQLPYKRVKELVYPERQRLNDSHSAGRHRKAYWWLYGSDAKGLYHAMGFADFFERHSNGWKREKQKLRKVIVCSKVLKYLTYVWTDSSQILSHRLAVFASDDVAVFTYLSSAINESWARQYSSSLESPVETTRRQTPLRRCRCRRFQAKCLCGWARNIILCDES